ncbi:MAG: hypothetical protein IIZ03_07210, partial [Succinivibrionaceae bacterium]|nr:hypothetical protein [Succinivibrionaceae bacterium]
DFGDAIRIGASSAPEDKEDVGKIFLVQSKVEAFSRGFLSELSNVMGEKERRMLPEGALLMTLENGIRFLKDYLDGDVYYKIHRPDHNLVRARAQFALVREMEKNLEEMIADPEKLQTMGREIQLRIDGRGTDRICRKIIGLCSSPGMTGRN